MQSLAAVTFEIDEFTPVVVRTDYADDFAWQKIKRLLDGVDEFSPVLVEDLGLAGLSADEVLALLPQAIHEAADAVFIADEAAMLDDRHALLAVSLLTRDDFDEREYEEHIEFGGQFRTLPVGVAVIQANLAVANAGFEDYAECAQRDPEGIFRG